VVKLERVTTATIADWVALRVELWPHEATAELEQQGRELLTREPDAVAFLLRDAAGAAIAMAEATIRRDYVNGCSTSPVAFLEGIYVRPAWRRQGAARRLCQSVEAWGQEQGCREFASDALLDNEVSHRMHRALGFEERERVVCFCKAIG
jgi:aminoglycoside 6'-N-acetyltransferase I